MASGVHIDDDIIERLAHLATHETESLAQDCQGLH